MLYTHIDRQSDIKKEGERQGHRYINVHILIRTHVSFKCQSRDESWQREKQTGKHKYQINMFSQTASRRSEGREPHNTRKPTPTPTSSIYPAKYRTCPNSPPKQQNKKDESSVTYLLTLRLSVYGFRFSVLGFRAMSNAHWISVSSSNHWLKPPTPPTPLTTLPYTSPTIPPWLTPPAPQMSGTCECGVYVPYIKGLWAKRLCVWQQQAFKGFSTHTPTQTQT